MITKTSLLHIKTTAQLFIAMRKAIHLSKIFYVGNVTVFNSSGKPYIVVSHNRLKNTGLQFFSVDSESKVQENITKIVRDALRIPIV